MGQIGSKYDSLKSEAEQRSGSEKQTPQTRIQRSILDSISQFWNDLTAPIKKWFADTFKEFWGGLFYEIIQGLIFIGIGVLVIKGLLLLSTAGAIIAVLLAVVGLIVGIALQISSRFEEYKKDNNGKEAEGWTKFGLGVLGILDITGIPYLIEGIFLGHRFTGGELKDWERGSRIGMGAIMLGSLIFAAYTKFKSGSKSRTPNENLETEISTSETLPSTNEPSGKISSNKSSPESINEVPQYVLASIRDAIVQRVKTRIAAQSNKFKLTYSEAELEGIIRKGKELGLSDQVIEDLIYTGSREAKAISSTDLIQQMEHWTNVISKRGFPEKFTDMPEFQQFSKDLLDGVQNAGLPADDVRIQGSSLRKTSANDVDIAVFVEEATFDNLLVERYHQKIALTEGGTKISLEGKSHVELLQLADDIRANPGKYNAQARTFQNAINNGIISSKSDIIKPLKSVRTDIAQKYPSLNLEAISILIKGGLFDVTPDLPVKSN